MDEVVSIPSAGLQLYGVVSIPAEMSRGLAVRHSWFCTALEETATPRACYSRRAS